MPAGVRARRFVRLYERSSSLAIHLETNDGEFVVKVPNNPEGPKVLINDWIGSQIASVMRIPLPEIAVVEIPAALEIPP